MGAVSLYLAHKKPPHPRTLQEAYAQGLTVVLGGGGAVSCVRSIPVKVLKDLPQIERRPDAALSWTMEDGWVECFHGHRVG